MLHENAKLIVMGGVVLALAVVPLSQAEVPNDPGAQAAAIAAGDPVRAEVRNGTTAKETEIIGRFNASTGSKGGYVTRQSNTQTGAKAGGGAIYGCRGAAGGTASGSAPCLRSVNLAAGFAFEFSSAGGVAGLIAVGDGTTPSPSARPFTTNANGVATGLNADRVDSLNAAEIAATPGPPSGAAGGELSGTYPNPGLAASVPGIAAGGVQVTSAGALTSSFNRSGGTPTVTHTGLGTYNVTFPGLTVAAGALPQVTLIGGTFGETSATTSGGGVQVFTANSAGVPTDQAFALTVFSTGS
jgi:hypothetical protein